MGGCLGKNPPSLAESPGPGFDAISTEFLREAKARSKAPVPKIDLGIDAGENVA